VWVEQTGQLRERVLHSLLEEVCEGVWAMPLLSPETCAALAESARDVDHLAIAQSEPGSPCILDHMQVLFQPKTRLM
jgi:hypothetical protein